MPHVALNLLSAFEKFGNYPMPVAGGPQPCLKLRWHCTAGSPGTAQTLSDAICSPRRLPVALRLASGQRHYDRHGDRDWLW